MLSFRLHAQTEVLYTPVDKAGHPFVIGDTTLRRQSLTIADTQQTSGRITYDAATAGGLFVTRLLRYANEQLRKGSFHQAITTLRTALFFSGYISGEQLTYIYNNLANTYLRTGDYNHSIHYYLLAIREMEKLPGKEAMHATLYSNLATLFIQMEDYSRALYYLNKGESILRPLGNPENYLSRLLLNKATALQHDQISAVATYREALSLSRSYGDSETVCTILNNLGDYYLQERMPHQAIQYLKESLGIISGQSFYIQAGNLISLGEAYKMLGNTDQAEHYLLLALHKAEESGMQKEVMAVHKLLSDLYGHTAQYRQAWQHQHQYVTVRDSMLNIRKVHDINHLEVKYRTAEKDKEIFRKELMITRQQHHLQEKNIWIACISAILMLLTILTFTLYRNHRHRQRLQQERIRNLQHEQELLRREQEIDRLKAMMEGVEQERSRLARELHDGIVSQLSAIKMNFNALSNRQHSAGFRGDFEEALQQLDEATEDLRNTSHNLMPQVLIRSGLQAAVETLCEKIRRSIPGLHMDCLVYGTLPPLRNEQGLMLYRIIQELVQNAVKHAQANYILVQMNCLDDTLDITVEDNGIGIDPEDAETHTTLGLRNIRERVHVLNGKMHIQAAPDSGTSVYLEFNCREWKTDNVCQ